MGDLLQETHVVVRRQNTEAREGILDGRELREICNIDDDFYDALTPCLLIDADVVFQV